MNILFHIDENAKWQTVLENASNAVNACNESGENLRIEILANGPAVIELKEQIAINLNLYDKYKNLAQEGVVFAACRNSLNKFVISEKELLDFVQVVPAGVIELAKKQEAGFSYIKP